MVSKRMPKIPGNFLAAAANCRSYGAGAGCTVARVTVRVMVMVGGQAPVNVSTLVTCTVISLPFGVV